LRSDEVRPPFTDAFYFGNSSSWLTGILNSVSGHWVAEKEAYFVTEHPTNSQKEGTMFSWEGRIEIDQVRNSTYVVYNQNVGLMKRGRTRLLGVDCKLLWLNIK